MALHGGHFTLREAYVSMMEVQVTGKGGNFYQMVLGTSKNTISFRERSFSFSLRRPIFLQACKFLF